VWHLLYAVKSANVVERVDAGRETTVQTEYLVVDEGSEREVIEQVCEELPDICVAIFAQALVVEAIYLRDLAGLVISAQDSDALRVSNFESDKKRDGLD